MTPSSDSKKANSDAHSGSSLAATVHSPLPWSHVPESLYHDTTHVGGRAPVIANDRLLLARVERQSDPRGRCPIAEANAALIVRAVNSHADLLAALRDMLRIATAASVGVTRNAPRLDRARAAIAKATGEPTP